MGRLRERDVEMEWKWRGKERGWAVEGKRLPLHGRINNIVAPAQPVRHSVVVLLGLPNDASFATEAPETDKSDTTGSIVLLHTPFAILK